MKYKGRNYTYRVLNLNLKSGWSCFIHAGVGIHCMGTLLVLSLKIILHLGWLFNYKVWFICQYKWFSYKVNMQPLNVIWLLFIFLSGISVQRYTFIPSIKEDGCKTIKVNGSLVKQVCRKVFWTLLLDGYEYRKRDAKGFRGGIDSSFR